MSPCLALSIIRYVSRVKWRNLGKRVAPSPTPWCSSYWKRNLGVAVDHGRQLYLPIKGERVPFCLKHMNSILFAFMKRPIPLAACSRLCSRDSAWAGLLGWSLATFVWVNDQWRVNIARDILVKFKLWTDIPAGLT